MHKSYLYTVYKISAMCILYTIVYCIIYIYIATYGFMEKKMPIYTCNNNCLFCIYIILEVVAVATTLVFPFQAHFTLTDRFVEQRKLSHPPIFTPAIYVIIPYYCVLDMTITIGIYSYIIWLLIVYRTGNLCLRNTIPLRSIRLHDDEKKCYTCVYKMCTSSPYPFRQSIHAVSNILPHFSHP